MIIFFGLFLTTFEESIIFGVIRETIAWALNQTAMQSLLKYAIHLATVLKAAVKVDQSIKHNPTIKVNFVFGSKRNKTGIGPVSW